MDERCEFIIENGTLKTYLGDGGDVAIPESVTALGENVFRENRTLTSVSFPSTLRVIAKGAFWGCEALISIHLPERVESLGPWCFFGCSQLHDVAFNDGLQSIGDGAFQGCRSLEEIDLPAQLHTMGSAVFDGCVSLRRASFPPELSDVGAGAFRSCTALKEVDLARVHTIGARAFWGCTALETIRLPETLEAIGDDAFYYCSALSSVQLPAGLQRIGRSAFYGCSRLCGINCLALSPEVGRAAFAKTPWWDERPDGCVHLGRTLYQYKGVIPAGSDFSVPEGTEKIAEFALCGAEIHSLTLPEGVVSLGESALEDCSALSALVLPDTLTHIGKHAFRFDRSLRSLTLPDALSSIADGAFFKCAGLRQITLPRSLRTLGSGVFEGCVLLEKLTIPEDAAFYRTIDGVLFSKNGKELCLYPEGKADKSYHIPVGVETLLPGAFIGVKKLRQLYLSATLDALPAYAFRQVPLNYVRLPRKIRRLPVNAFAERTYVAFYYPDMCDKVAHPVYLGGPIEQVPPRNRNAALQGFLYASGIGEEAVKPWRASYVESVRRNESAYARMAAGNEPLLRLMLEEDLLSQFSVDMLLGGLIGAERTDLTAALLAYKQRLFPERNRSVFSLDEGSDDNRAAETARRRETIRQRIGIDGLHITAAGKLRKFGYYAPSGVVDFSDLRAYIQKRGGIFQASADENTDCMICNDPTQAPDRIARAAELGVPVITEAEFLSIASTIPKRNYYSTT